MKDDASGPFINEFLTVDPPALVVNRYTLYVEDIDEENSPKLKEACRFLRRFGTENDILEIRINSRGGFVDDGLEMINTLTDTFVNITTTIDYVAASMAAMIFLKGTNRIVYPHSRIMFHSYSVGYFGKAGEVEDVHKSDVKVFTTWFKEQVKPYFTKKELKQIALGKDVWLGYEEMIDRNMCTHYFSGDDLIEVKNDK